MEQRDLYDGQAANLRRVDAKLRASVLEFCRGKLAAGTPRFTAGELAAFVAARVPATAPDSPSRVLRLVRKDCLIAYTVISRRDSLYEITWASDSA